MCQILVCVRHVLNWYYPLKSEEKQWIETCDMKKPSVVSLSMELYYKSSSTADSTRNIQCWNVQCCFLSNVLIRVLGSSRLQLYLEFF